MIRSNIKKIIRNFFFLNPTIKLRVREIERKLKLSLPSVIRYCKELEMEGILMKKKIGDVVFYTTDKTNKKYLLEKKIFNLRQLYNSGLINHLKQELSNPSIIVFGSYSKGEDIEKSDIDLYLETLSKKNIKLEKFEKKLKRTIQVFKHKDITEIKNLHLSNNIINGILLNGFIEVFK